MATQHDTSDDGRALFYIKDALKSFVGDPADSDFQDGYRMALDDVLRDVYGLEAETVMSFVKMKTVPKLAEATD